MKKILLISALAFYFFPAVAQKISVNESTGQLAGADHKVLVVTIYGVDASDIQKKWSALMKDYDAKVSTQKDEVFADNAMIKEMGNNPVDIYARTEKTSNEGEVKLITGFDLGGAYINSSDHPDKFPVAKKIVNDFALKLSKDAIHIEMEASQKVLDKLYDQKKNLEKDLENLNKDIQNYNDKIKKAQEDIVNNKANQEKKEQEINAQKNAVEEIAEKEKKVE